MDCQDARYIIALYSEDEDGVVTDRINLADGASYGVGPGAIYAPPPKQKVASGANSLYRHGSDVVRVRYNNSTVDIRELTILGTPDILAERIMRITTMLEKARLRQERGWGEKVFIERDWRYSTYYAWDIEPAPEYFYETVDILKKEVYQGEFIPPREDVGGILRDGTLAPCRLSLGCYPFWQGRERNVVFEHLVENHYCGVYPPAPQNWINLDAADLPGDAPCLLKIAVELLQRASPPFGSGWGIRNFRLGIKQQCHPLDMSCCSSLTFQAEDATMTNDTAIHPADADFSCEAGARVSPSTNTNLLRLQWRPTGAQLPQGTYKPLLRIRNRDAARTVLAQFRIGVQNIGITEPYWTGPQVEVPAFAGSPTDEFAMIDLGVFQIPPVEMDGHLPDNYWKLEIWTQSDAASGSIDIDYALLLPVEAGLKLMQFPVSEAPDTVWWVGDSLILNGFNDPPTAIVRKVATSGYLGAPSDDLGFAAYVQPEQDYCIVFSADIWDIDDDMPENDLYTLLKVTIDIIPQYLYIR